VALLGWAAVNFLNSLDERLGPSSFDAFPSGSDSGTGPASGSLSARAMGWYGLRAISQDLPSPWRALLALGVVFLLLATTGWTANRHSGGAMSAKETAVAAWLRASVGGHRLPRPESRPSVISHFFATLTSAQRVRLAERYPLVVGNLDGAPIPLRYRANRISLAKSLYAERLRARTADLTDKGKRRSEHRMERLESLLDEGRQILSFDPTGRGRVAEVLGDLTAARRISVVVPGVDTDLLSFERDEKPWRAPAGMARALYGAAREASPRTPMAVVAWADYRTPIGLGMDAATGNLAGDGADRLSRMVSALPERAETALFCHSYGSVVCGMAAPGLPEGRVSDIAVAGSPGMRAERAADLHTSARVWAARDPGDWIADVPHLEFAGIGHGADPVSPAFGARVVASGGAEGHAGYFALGTASLSNFARVAQGQYSAVACASGSGCTTGLI
jgi:hypothetical protein